LRGGLSQEAGLLTKVRETEKSYREVVPRKVMQPARTGENVRKIEKNREQLSRKKGRKDLEKGARKGVIKTLPYH